MKKTLMIILALSFFISCKEDKSDPRDLSKTYSSELQRSEIENFYFPDTVDQNTMIKGNLRYNRNFGDVIDSEIKERYIFFHVGTDKDSSSTALEGFDKFPLRLAFEDTVGDGLFKFETVFTQPGINYLHGVVEDIYVIEGSDQSEDRVKVSNSKTILTKEVFVVKKQ